MAEVLSEARCTVAVSAMGSKTVVMLAADFPALTTCTLSLKQQTTAPEDNMHFLSLTETGSSTIDAVCRLMRYVCDTVSTKIQDFDVAWIAVGVYSGGQGSRSGHLIASALGCGSSNDFLW